jgi:hypothetical protein
LCSSWSQGCSLAPFSMRSRTLLSTLGPTLDLGLALTRKFSTSCKYHLTLWSGLVSYGFVSSS